MSDKINLRFLETTHSSGTKFWRVMQIDRSSGGLTRSATIRHWGKMKSMIWTGGQFKVESGGALIRHSNKKLSGGYQRTARSCERSMADDIDQLESEILRLLQMTKLVAESKGLLLQIFDALGIDSGGSGEQTSKPKPRIPGPLIDRGEAWGVWS